MRFSTEKWVYLGLAAALLLVGAVGLISYRSTRGFIETTDWVTHTQEVLEKLNVLQVTLMDAELGRRGFLLTGEDRYLEPCDAAFARANQQVADLRALVADNPAQQQRLDTLEKHLNPLLAQLGEMIDLRKRQGPPAAQKIDRPLPGDQRMEQIRGALRDMADAEKALLQERKQQIRPAEVMTTVTSALAGALAVLFVSLAGWFIRRDMMARQRAEAELQAANARFSGILEIAEDAVVSVDASMHVILFNRGAERIFGYAAEEILGKSLDILLPRRFVPMHRQHMAEFARSGQQARRMGQRSEVYALRKDGTEFPVDASISKLELLNETVFTATLRDITERKRAEAAIRQLNQELEQRVQERTAELAESNRQLLQKNEENETFVYSVSHDLRSPLVNLEGFSKELALVCRDVREILTRSELPEAVRERGLNLLDSDMSEAVRFIQTAVSRLSNIIEALLRLSRAGRVVYQQQLLDTRKIVERVVDSMRAVLVAKGASATVSDLPPICGDATAVEQVFANLIGNALNYLDPTRPGQIEIGIVRQEKGTGSQGTDGWQTYFVKDNGLGIASTYGPKVFQAFQRLHPDKAKGEGIGLTIVRRVVERHGGKVWFESTVDQGTTFYFTLPPGPTHDSFSMSIDHQAAAAAKGGSMR